MMITFNGANEVMAWMEALPDSVRAALQAKSSVLAQMLEQKVGDKLSGQMIKERSGRLKSAIISEQEEDGDLIGARVFMAGDVPYAAIQELGGSTSAHIIEASNAKALAFSWQGKSVFYKQIHHPGSVIPAHYYLRLSLEEMNGDMVSSFEEALQTAIES